MSDIVFTIYHVVILIYREGRFLLGMRYTKRHYIFGKSGIEAVLREKSISFPCKYFAVSKKLSTFALAFERNANVKRCVLSSVGRAIDS